jgi:hypothetical protein
VKRRDAAVSLRPRSRYNDGRPVAFDAASRAQKGDDGDPLFAVTARDRASPDRPPPGAGIKNYPESLRATKRYVRNMALWLAGRPTGAPRARA